MQHPQASQGSHRGWAVHAEEAVYTGRGERELIAALEQAHAAGPIAAGRPLDVVTLRLDTFERRGAHLLQEADVRGERCRLVLADSREWRLGQAARDAAARRGAPPC